MENTTIAWTDHTFNPWRGCEKVSPGCAHCYAETMSKRNPAVLGEWGPNGKRVLASDAAWKVIERLNRKAGTDSRPDPYEFPLDTIPYTRPRVFCASMADWLDPKVPVDWLARLLDTIRRCQNLDFLLLTKRPEHFFARLQAIGFQSSLNYVEHHEALITWIRAWFGGEPRSNVWFGVSAEDQQRWDERVPVLLSIPARVRFVSVEPMLGVIRMFDVDGVVSQRMQERNPRETLWPADLIDWVIFGGESGPRARSMEAEWLADGVRQCDEAGVEVFVKQDSGRLPGLQGRIPNDLWRRKEWPEVAR